MRKTNLKKKFIIFNGVFRSEARGNVLFYTVYLIILVPRNAHNIFLFVCTTVNCTINNLKYVLEKTGSIYFYISRKTNKYYLKPNEMISHAAR